MLHRAASNAYSWWWASHIRTKQSKWLDNNLQEMDEKVQYMLKLIDEDGDSFAKRAESYYRKRPELIGFVEEFYRAYRALAERYDHISGELQNANHTIATVFPEQVQFAMDEEDYTGSPKVSARQVHTSKIPKDLPEVPKITIPDFLRNLKKEKSSPAKPPKRMQSKKTSTVTTTNSHMSKDEAIQEIDKLQKGILALQTEKEFVKSSYENRLGKYWEIEKAITDMQEKVCGLQDEFNVGTLIEDHEARTLMASTALKSCQETLVQLQEKQERSNEEARLEYERIKNAREKIVVLKGKFLQGQTDQIPSEGPPLKLEEEVQNVQQEITDAESVREKIREHFEMNSSSNLTVPEMAEKIDELVTKVISLETAVSSQTALIDRLRSETDGLQEHLRSLEEDKVALLQDSNKLNKKLRELEAELNTVQELNRSVANQNNNLQTHFTEAHCNLDHLSEKLKSVKPLDEEIDSTGPSKEEVDMLVNVEPRKLHEEPEEMVILSEDAPNEKEEVDVLVHVESHREHEEPEETITISEDAPKEKDEATGVTEVRVVQDPVLHVNDQAEAPTLHVNEKEEAPSLHLSDQAEAPNLQVKMKDEALSLHVSDQAEAPNLQVKMKDEAPSLLVSDQAEAPNLQVKMKDEAPSLHVSDQAEAPYVQVKMKDEAPNLHVSDQVEALSGHVNGQAEVLSGHVNDQAEPTLEPNSGIMDADIFETNLELMQQDDVGKQDSSQKDDKVLDSEPQEGFNDEEKDEPNWQELYLSGLEDRERILLAEYTSILRKYKETRKQLSELQIENHDSQFDAMVQLRELKNAIAIKDEEIKSLRQKLKFLQETDNSQQEKAHENGIPQQEKAHVSENSQQEKVHDMLEGGFSFQTFSSKTLNLEDSRASSLQDRNAEERGSLVSSTADRATDIIPTKVEEDDEVRVPIGENHTVSALEEKFRRDIDELLEQNLEFWLRFSGSFHQIQTFQTSIEDLQGEYMKLKENQNQEDSTSSKHGSSLQSNARPIYKHMREIQTDLTVWLEKNMLLKDELKYRLASLRSIYDEITRSSKTGSGTEVEFTSYQAAKFQGEVLNMQQENNKVADELQAGLEHVKGLQVEIDKALVQMNDELKLSGSKGHHHHVIHSLSRTRIPLRSFLFGAKKRQKPSFFACMNPALQKQYSDLQGHVPR